MARYNSNKPKNTTVVTNHQGGKSYKMDPKLELVSILATGFNNTYYETLGERELRFADLIKELSKKDVEFVAKALVYARSVMGQRSVTHFGSVQLAKFLSGHKIAKRFFSKRDRKGEKGGIVYRLDDMLEIISCYQILNPDQPLPNSMKKGFKLALESADSYELAKYQGNGKAVSLIDVINLVHPKPSSKMEDTFKQLMNGELKQFNTVEDKNTKSGQEVAKKVKEGKITKEEAQVELKAAKEENFGELISTRKIGYLALLRNLRNIIDTGANATLVKEACDLLTDPKLIKQSLVFPHQIDLALEVLISECGNSKASIFIKALNKAYELAIPNLTELFTNGNTAIVFDSSGSMGTIIKLVSGKAGSEAAIAKASLIAATLAKGIGADVFHFANYCEQINYNPGDSVNTLKQQFLSHQGKVGYGTEFNSIMTKLAGKYDRVFVISDMQGKDALSKSSYNNSYIYSIDIIGYGTTMFKPDSKVFQIFGYSSDIYELIKKVEIDPKALLKEIEAIEI